MKNGKVNTFLVGLIMFLMLCYASPVQAYIVEFNTISAPTVVISNSPQVLGKVSIGLPDVRALPTKGIDEEGDWLTVSLPNGCKFDGSVGQDASAAGLGITTSGNIAIGASVKTAANTVEFEVFNCAANDDVEFDGSILLNFNSILVRSGSGDIVASFLSNSSVFGPLHKITIAKIRTTQATATAGILSVKPIYNTGGEIDTIFIFESAAGVFAPGETIQVSLPAGFTWNDSNVNSIPGAWALSGKSYNWAIDPENPRILEVYINDKVSSGSAGRINIGSGAGGYFAIDVQDTAEYGNIYITVSSDKGAVSATNILAASYLYLESIAITNPADKLIYHVGDPLDITGLVVTGTYSDGSTRIENITAENIIGFDSSNINPALTLTVSVDDQTADYTVEIKAARSVVLTPQSPVVTVTNGDTSLEITVPDTVSNAALATTPTKDEVADTAVVTLPAIHAASNTDNGDIELDIAAGTQISGSADWDGTINLPVLIPNENVIAIPDASVSAAIEVGLPDTALTFSQPVRILLAGQGEKNAGWVRNGTFYPITYQMTADTAADLGTNTDGFLTVGNDLVIWTTHFTTFVAYSETAGQTATPVIAGTPVEGDTSVSGTAAPGANVVLSINGTAEPSVTADGSTGSWTVTGLTLVSGDLISVTAQISGEAMSEAATAVVADVSNVAAALKGLSIKEGSDGSGQELIGSFNGDTLNYSVTVANEIAAVKVVVAEAPNTAAKVYLDAVEITDGIITLAEGENTVRIVVSETGKQDRTYSIKVTRDGIDECFIATAAFGSKFTWPVALLRHFRDQYLLTNSMGTAFVKFYYQYSPPVAEMIAGSKPLKVLVRLLLAPVIAIVYMLYHPLLMAVILLMISLLNGYRLRRKRILA